MTAPAMSAALERVADLHYVHGLTIGACVGWLLGIVTALYLDALAEAHTAVTPDPDGDELTPEMLDHDVRMLALHKPHVIEYGEDPTVSELPPAFPGHYDRDSYQRSAVRLTLGLVERDLPLVPHPTTQFGPCDEQPTPRTFPNPDTAI